RVGIAQAARIRARADRPGRAVERRALAEAGRVGQEIAIDLTAGGHLDVEKVIALYTSRDRAIADPWTEARTAVERAGTFDDLLATHVLAWRQLWRRCDMEVVDV